jgi:hypothetical protein
MYETQHEERIEGKDGNAYQVRFTRKVTWDSARNLDEDYADHIEVMFGETWTTIENLHPESQEEIIYGIDTWLMKNYPETPDLEGQEADHRMDLERDK